MPEPTGSEARLQSLRRRWETEKSTAFLPLAEEYRRLGRLREAIDVLESGLKSNPGYTSGLVALGRCRLESGDAANAASVLERVVAQDPEQLVASKLLIEAYLRTGRKAEARRRLDIYSTLNAKDPEIARLADRLVSLNQPPVAASAEREDPHVEAEPEAASAAEADAEPEMPAPPERREAEPEVAAAAPSPPVTPSAAVAPSPRATVAPPAILFAGLDGPVAASRYVRGLVSEGLFRLMFPTAPAGLVAAEPASPPAPEPRAPSAPSWMPPASLPEAAGAPESAPHEPAAELAESSESAAPLEEFDADVERAISGFVATAPAPVEPRPEVAAEAAQAPAVGISSGAAPPPPVEVSAPDEGTEPDGAEGAAGETATLGDLYLQQGHVADAERIFGAVLARDPGNDEARRGLGEAQERLRQTGGLSSRRAAALRDYLRRLRGREDRHVP